ncbi:MAG: amidohydrolase family protein [bacterium]
MADQQVVYPLSAMPRVDMHTHMDAKTEYAKAVDSMDQWGGTITISLAGLFWVKDNSGSNASPASVRQMPGNDMVYVKEKLNDRILFVPGAFTIPSKGIWWGVDEIKTFKEQGFVGLKLWPHGAILSSKTPLIHEQLDEAGRQGMPLVGYHTGDPGNAKSNNAAFPKFEEDTIEVAKKHPQTIFIFAHGLFMLQNDSGLDKLGGIFDQYPNVFVDLAFTHNSRQPEHYTVSKAREFYIKYRDRILFGSDNFGAGRAEGYLNERQVLETSQVTSGLHGGPKMEGLNLPDPVLNHIYYWNAARLIPRVKQVLEARGFKIGYELGSFTFDRLPPDVTVNKLTVSGKAADLTGTLGCVTESLVVKIAGTYDVKVTAKNSIGLVRADSTTNELIVVSRQGALR